MKELYIDFDGVILDTIPHLYKALDDANVPFDDERAKRDFFSTHDYSTIINDENILNDSINSIKKLKDSNLFLISILTHVNSLEEGKNKIKYIRNYFKDITIILTPKELEKTEMVHTKDAILVDDYSGNLRVWKSNGGIPVRFSKEKEDGDFITINKLDELIDIFGDTSES